MYRCPLHVRCFHQSCSTKLQILKFVTHKYSLTYWCSSFKENLAVITCYNSRYMKVLAFSNAWNIPNVKAVMSVQLHECSNAYNAMLTIRNTTLTGKQWSRNTSEILFSEPNSWIKNVILFVERSSILTSFLAQI